MSNYEPQLGFYLSAEDCDKLKALLLSEGKPKEIKKLFKYFEAREKELRYKYKSASGEELYSLAQLILAWRFGRDPP